MTLPERRHPVHTFRRFGAPFTSARTRWMFGFQRRLVRRCEWETFMPNDGFLPQMSQTDAMVNSPHCPERLAPPGETECPL